MYLAAAASLLLLQTAAAFAGPVEVLQSCAADAPMAAHGLQKLAAACPELPNALQMLGMDKLLAGGFRDRLTPRALLDLAELASRYDASRIPAGPDIAALRAIVDALNREPAPNNSWWQRFSSWLRDWLARHDASTSGWFGRWLDQLAKSPSFLRVIGVLCIALILAAAVAVILNELRAAGAWQRFRRIRLTARRTQAPRDATPAAGAALGAPEGVKELLRQLVARLAQTGRLGNERSLTHRELIVRSRLDSAEQRDVLATVAVTAEQATYGNRSADAEQSSVLIARGRMLLKQLEKGPA